MIEEGEVIANRNLTEIPILSVYSGIVSLSRLHMMIFIAELKILHYHPGS